MVARSVSLTIHLVNLARVTGPGCSTGDPRILELSLRKFLHLSADQLELSRHSLVCAKTMFASKFHT